MKTKTCRKCNMEKPLNEFYKRGDGDNVRSRCKICMAIEKSAYQVLNLDKIKAQAKEYRDANREKRKKDYIANREEILKMVKLRRLANVEEINAKRRDYWAALPKEKKIHHREICKRWEQANPEKVKANYDKKNMANRKNPKTHLSSCISLGIRRSLKGKKSGLHWEDLVGYDLNDLIRRLKTTLPNDYRWDDYASGGKLHIDHIIPVSAFNFETIDDIDFRRCWGLGNLRLITAKENLSKGSKLDRPFQPALALDIPRGQHQAC